MRRDNREARAHREFLKPAGTVVAPVIQLHDRKDVNALWVRGVTDGKQA